MSTTIEFLDAYDRIKAADDLATKQLAAAIAQEEQECPIKAIENYEKASQIIEEVFKIPVGLPDEPEDIEAEWLDACLIIKKLKAANETIGERLKVLRQQNALLIDQDAKEATEEEREESSGSGNTKTQNGDEPKAKKRSVLLENPEVANDLDDAIKSYKKYITALREVLGYNCEAEKPEDHVDEVFFDKIFQAHVKLYKISGCGLVETIVGESVMSLIMCTTQSESKWNFLNGVSFMQCSLPPTASTSSEKSTDINGLCWIYPLLPTVTTCYRTEYGAFIFPDMEFSGSDIHSTAFGIIFSNEITKLEDEAFADLQQFFLDLLEAILAGEVEKLTEANDWKTQGIIDESERLPRMASEKISKGIVTGADFIARMLVRGAEKTGDFLDRGAPFLMSRMQQAPRNSRPVSMTVQKTVGAAKVISGAAAGATGWVAGKIGEVASNVGAYLAPHVEAQGANVLEHGFGYQKNDAESKMKGAMTLAAGAVEGFTTVYGGLEKSADLLGKSLSDNSVKIISHKYGSSAGDVASDTFDTIGNTWHVNKNLKIIRPKGFAENVFKKTGTGVIDDYKGSLRGKKNVIHVGDLHPDLCSLKKKEE